MSVRMKFNGGPFDGQLKMTKIGDNAAQKVIFCEKEARKARMVGHYLLERTIDGLAVYKWNNTRAA